MAHDQDLFGKTFDQQVLAVGKDIAVRDITPNRRIPAEIVFEPTGSRVRVTAYDENNHILFQRDDKKTEDNIAPKRIRGEVVFEPMGSGVRVTARDEDHKMLWGYVGSKETAPQIHCLVAVYDTFQATLKHELEKRGLIKPEKVDPIKDAKNAINSLEKTVKWLRDGLEVKNVSDATLERARTIARILSDADRQISLEASALKGMKSKTEPSDGTL